jgi:disulfide bond formation protein DsbB
LAALSAAAVGVSLALTEWLHLEACHLCVFQRLLFMVLVVLALGAGLGGQGLIGRLLGAFAATTAAGGVAAAVYQSRLQLQSDDSLFSCAGSAEPNVIERFVEWLGMQWPGLFMPSGFCDDPGALIIGLSLANWTAIIFGVSLVLAGWALWRSRV